MKIALYTHSTNPRGGVVHTLELGDALTRAGHDVTIHAPDPTGAGFFRKTAATQVSIKCARAPASLHAMMLQRIAEIAAHISTEKNKFDIHHAQDTINANALAECVQWGDIPGFIRTIHHVDHFADPQLHAWQQRGIEAAARHFCVSAVWQQLLAAEYNLHAEIVPNGVSLGRFSPDPTMRDITLRAELHLGEGPLFLCIGGIEPRKNTINILRGFELVHAAHPQAQLIIAGGSSLLDHSQYQQQFRSQLTGSVVSDQVNSIGLIADADMPSLFRVADALVFPSLKEGFGLVVLEALATETPVVVSNIAPFTEYLTANDCTFCDPHDPVSIAHAMLHALSTAARGDALRARRNIAASMGWHVSATRHLDLYQAARNLEFYHA